MEVHNPELLRQFREKGKCEFCGQRSGTGLDPHHIFSKGIGGGSQLDVAINLIALCRMCHRYYHNGKIYRQELLEIVAKREGTTLEAIVDEIYRLRRTPKGIYGNQAGSEQPG